MRALGLPVVLDDGNQYLYGAGLSAMKQRSAWSYYLADGLGSTMAVVDASGVVQKSYQYDVYGEVTGGSGSLANEFDFAGQQTDPTGLQYLRARYYDPVAGVFLSREPLAVAPGWTGNPFGYGGANPARFVDPTGGRPVDSDGCEDGNEACYRRVQAESEAACAGLYFYTYTYCKEQLGGRNIFKDAYHWLACDGGLFGGSKCTDVLGVVVDGVTLLHGKNGLKSQQKRWKTNGLPEYESGKRVENMKEYEGLPPDFDLWFDADGNVYRAWQTGKNRVDFEKIGNVFDDVWK